MGKKLLKEVRKKKSSLQEDPADRLVPNKWICLKTLWTQEKNMPFVSKPTVCLYPTVACMAEHMFSEQELKQKVFFVIIHSFVYTSLFPFWSHANSSYAEHLSSEGLHSSVCFSDYLLLLESVELRCNTRLTSLMCALDSSHFAILHRAEYNLHTNTEPPDRISVINS